MHGFLVDSIYVIFEDQVFQQSVGIPMGINCAPLLADLFLYSNEAEFLQKLLHLFVLSRMSNCSTIWRLPPLPVTGLQI
jgi:hypothetical protein